MDAKSTELLADKTTAFFVHVSTQIIGSTSHHITLKLQNHSPRAALELLITLYPY